MKARGYCARIAMVIHSLEQALQSIHHESEQQDWDSNVSVKAMKSASAIIDHFNKQKFIMLGLDEIDSDADSSDVVPLSNRMCRLLSITWRADDGTITPSEVSQKHLCDRVGQSYPSFKAVETLRVAESMGYGTVEDTTAINYRSLSYSGNGHMRISLRTARSSLNEPRSQRKHTPDHCKVLKAPLNTSWKQMAHTRAYIHARAQIY